MRRPPKPSPAMVVALIAVVLAATGTATAALKGKDKKKVRSIADQEIARAAPGLSVATAANALNADSLGGTAAGGYAKVFSGSVPIDPGPGNPDQQVMFSVPQLGVSVIADNETATTAAFRIRNDRASGAIEFAKSSDFDGDTSVPPGGIGPAGSNQEIPNSAAPVVVTSSSVPGAVLTILCGVGAGSTERCTGLLAGG